MAYAHPPILARFQYGENLRVLFALVGDVLPPLVVEAQLAICVQRLPDGKRIVIRFIFMLISCVAAAAAAVV